MSASINEIAEGIRDRLAIIDGLRAFAYQPEQLNPPFAFPELVQVVFHRSMGIGVYQSEWLIHVIVGRYTDRTAFALLNDLLSPNGERSVREALESDLTLNGTIQTLILSNAADITSVSNADAEFLEIQFNMTCMA